MGAALPRVLFQDCYRYCVGGGDYLSVQAAPEQQCILNCQQKASKAFDIYMAV
jgi:hypothetical protein